MYCEQKESKRKQNIKMVNQVQSQANNRKIDRDKEGERHVFDVFFRFCKTVMRHDADHHARQERPKYNIDIQNACHAETGSIQTTHSGVEDLINGYFCRY
jgi:hypothetical protein